MDNDFVIPILFVPNTLADANAVNTNFAAVAEAINAGTTDVVPATTDFSALNIYNAFVYGISGSSSATQNTLALNNACLAAQSLFGGTIVIPNLGDVNYQFNGTVSVNTQAYNNIIIGGTSGNQKLVQTVGFDLFYLNNGGGSGGSNIGGSWIHDLHITFSPLLTTGAAIDIATGQNTFIDRVVMSDTPVGIFFNNTLEAVATNCNITYSKNINGMVGFLVSGPQSQQNGSNQIRLSKCQVGFQNQGSNSYGIQVTQVVHCTIDDCYSYGAPIGIGLTPSAVTQNDVQQVTLINTQIGAFQYGVLCQPLGAAGSGSKLRDFRIISGQIQGGNNATNTSVGVYIDTNGASNLWVDQGKIKEAIIEGWGLYGIQINSGQNILIGYSTIASNGTAAIAVTGAAFNVRISDCDLSPTFEGGTPQTYALLVTNTSAGVAVDNCNMVGYATPVSVPNGAPLNLVITNCAGYNDQGKVITTVTPMPGLYFSAQTAGTTPYFGPATFEVTGGTIASIQFSESISAVVPTYTSPLTSGTFSLSPGQFCKLNYTGNPTFTMVGR